MCKVSIVIPTYNRTKYLEETVRSVLNQSFQNFEIIIVDDCSDLKYHADQNMIVGLDPRIRIIRSKHNLGVSESRNIGIKDSKGQFIQFIDDDDTIGQEVLLHGLNIFKEKEGIDVVMLSSTIHPDSLKSTYIYHSLHKVFSDNSKKEKRITARDQWTFIRRSPSINSMLCKKEVFSNASFKPSLSYGEDGYLWMKLLQQNKVFYKTKSQGDTAVYVRKHTGNHLSVAAPKIVINYLEIIKKDFSPLNSKSKIEIQWRLLHCYIKIKDQRNAMKSLIKCFINPLHFIKRIVIFSNTRISAEINLYKFKQTSNKDQSGKLIQKNSRNA